MLDLYIAVTVCITKTAAAFRNYIEESRRKKYSIQKGLDFYIDRYGTKRRVANDEPYEIFYDALDNQTWEINPYTFEKKKNLTVEKKKRIEENAKQEAIARGEEFYAFEGSVYHCNERIVGQRFKRIGSNGIYVSRWMTGGKFWLNINTGMFEYMDPPIRPEQVRTWYLIGNDFKSEWNSGVAKKLIQKLNEKQTDLICRFGYDSRAVWHNDAEH